MSKPLLLLSLAFSSLLLNACGSSAPPPPPPNNPVAQVSFVSPTTLSPNAPFTITIFGSQFFSGAQVLLGSTPLAATFVDASHLTATGTAPATAGSANLTVVNPLTSNTPSNPFAVTVTAVNPRAAIRFLEQSTFGPNDAQLLVVETGGMESFLTAQFQAPASPYPDTPPMRIDLGVPLATFFVNALDSTSTSDQLRQRVMFVLNQIFVVSGNKVGQPDYYTPYLRVLTSDAFGNYRTIMGDVTLNPAMGRYLDMANNNAPPPGAHANENYAREFMQLFTIGPNMLNADGTTVLQNGNFVATYSQTDIQELALAFTGWTISGPNVCPRNNYSGNGGLPMVPCDAHHDISAKTILGTTLPPNQSAQLDLTGALDTIFKHPNLPPFVAHRFIQHLVTSNPSQAYVTRAANAFASGTFTSNGTTFGGGQRGDMQALVAAILLDPEARRGDDPSKENLLDGHLREPVLYTTSVLRAFHATTTSDNGLYYITADMGGEFPFFSPSVFNFYSPLFNIPLTPPPPSPLSGPEFQLFTSVASLSRVNDIQGFIFCCLEPHTNIDFNPYVSLAANDPGIMVDAMGLQLLHGTMSPAMRTVVLDTVNGVPSSDPLARARTAAYLIATSPQYQVQR